MSDYGRCRSDAGLSLSLSKVRSTAVYCELTIIMKRERHIVSRTIDFVLLSHPSYPLEESNNEYIAVARPYVPEQETHSRFSRSCVRHCLKYEEI